MRRGSDFSCLLVCSKHRSARQLPNYLCQTTDAEKKRPLPHHRTRSEMHVLRIHQKKMELTYIRMYDYSSDLGPPSTSKKTVVQQWCCPGQQPEGAYTQETGGEYGSGKPFPVEAPETTTAVRSRHAQRRMHTRETDGEYSSRAQVSSPHLSRRPKTVLAGCS